MVSFTESLCIYLTLLSALLKASSIKAGSKELRPSGVPGSFTSPARTGVWLPLRNIRRSERLLLPFPYCSILACVKGQSGREENNASAQDLTSAQNATSFSRTSFDLLMQLAWFATSCCLNRRRSFRAMPGGCRAPPALSTHKSTNKNGVESPSPKGTTQRRQRPANRNRIPPRRAEAYEATDGRVRLRPCSVALRRVDRTPN